MQALEEYRRRLGAQQARAAAARRRDLRLGAAKLVAFFLLLALAWLAAISRLFPAAWLLLPLGALVALFLIHSRALREREQAERTVAYYERGLARLEDRWSGTGASGERFRDPRHAYADDLDLFGPGGLFELISGARTAMGEERLAQWMRAPAPLEEIRRRQVRVAALREGLDLRQEIAALGDDLKKTTDPAALARWAAATAKLPGAAVRWGCAAVAVATLASGLYALGTARVAPVFILILVQVLIASWLREPVGAALGAIGANGEGLRLFAEVLGRIPDPAPAVAAGVAALRRLARLADWIEASQSLIGHLLDFTVLYSVQLAFAAAAWRRRHGAGMALWLEAVAEFEALLSLASHAFEHPDDPFPEFVELTAAAPAPLFHGEGLGHPLLPESRLVRNSIALDASTRLLLVSGSNMSGKSTLLRTVGINAVLAQMGAPVRAQRLRLTPLALGTRLRTADSLQQGRSGFYAEILRLRQVVELTAGPLPVLYLFDELMEGTNSHDRVRGSAGLLRALLAQATLGLVTTHDLALAALAEELGGAAGVVRNVHFEDQIEGDDVRFDHHLRDGVVTKSNALALMRIIGLKI